MRRLLSIWSWIFKIASKLELVLICILINGQRNACFGRISWFYKQIAAIHARIWRPFRDNFKLMMSRKRKKEATDEFVTFKLDSSGFRPALPFLKWRAFANYRDNCQQSRPASSSHFSSILNFTNKLAVSVSKRYMF